MKRLLPLLVLCAALAAAACDDGPAATSLARRVAALPLVDIPNGPYWPGRQAVFRFQTLDREGMPVPGVQVSFRTRTGGGSIEPGTGTTDEEGVVAVRWTLGEPGTHTLTARVVGTAHDRAATITVTPGLPQQVVLSADSITLGGPTCYAELSVSGLTSRDYLTAFFHEPPQVLGSIFVGPRTGTVAWMFHGVVARAPGTGRVIATDAFGHADTVHVRVLDTMPQVAFQSDTTRMAVGDTAYLSVNASGACGDVWSNPVAGTGIAGDTSRVNTYSSDLSVLTVLPRPHPTKQVVALKAGTVRVVTKYWGAADTATVVVQ